MASKEISNEDDSEPLRLQITADKDVYSFYYSFAKQNDDLTKWNLLKENVDAKYLSVKIPQDFTGCIFALYATSMGKDSINKASFDYFKYSGDDEVYNR